MKDNLITASVFLILLTGISKITGFIREMVLAYFYGASAMTDAYITATTVVTIFIGGITSATALAYIPRATAARVKNQDVSYMTSNLMTACAVLILIISIIAMFFSRELTKLFAMGFDEQTLTLAAGMTFLILPFCFVYAMNNIMVGYLENINSFWFIGLSAILSNIVIIFFITVSSMHACILALGFACSWVIPAVWAFFLIRKKGLHYSPIINVQDSTLRAIIISSIPIFFGQLVLQLNTLVDRNFASILGEGIISAMQYANKLNILFITLFVISIATALFPKFSEQVANDDIVGLKKTASKSINVVLLFVIPVVTGVIILAQPIVELAFMRGEFDRTAANITTNALTMYSLGMPGLSLAEILNREFYALKDTRTPVICSVASISTNIILNFILVKRFGYIGLAVATSIAATVLAVILLVFLRRKIGAIGMRHFIYNLIKMLIAVLIMAVIVECINDWAVSYLGLGTIARILTLISNGLAGAVVYFTFVYIFKVPEVLEVWQMLKQRFVRDTAETTISKE